jgi:Group 4 capsule polysaccharide lipoprotein gfcB, YjbF
VPEAFPRSSADLTPLLLLRPMRRLRSQRGYPLGSLAFLGRLAFVAALLMPLLQGCAAQSAASWDTLSLAMGIGQHPGVPQDPTKRYLRVDVNGRTIFMVLGYVDRDEQGRPVEVWYSSDRAVLRLVEGRLAGLVGAATEWREVDIAEAPSWSAVLGSGKPMKWHRSRDEMPGYRIGVRELLETRRVSEADPRVSGSPPHENSSVQWFEDAVISRNASGPAMSARYAVAATPEGPRVVSGEACLSEGFCLRWQPWQSVPVKTP